MTIFFVGLALARYFGESLFPGRFFSAGELFVAIGVCWTSNILSIVCVDAARRQSGNGIAGVWIGTAPRLGGPMLAVAVLAIAGGHDRTIACLVLVYLVSLPLTVYLTLPEVNRKIETTETKDFEANSKSD